MNFYFFRNEKYEQQPNPRKKLRYDTDISMSNLDKIFTDCDDFQKRELILGETCIKAWLVYIDGIASGDSIGNDVIKPITSRFRMSELMTESGAIESIFKGKVYSATSSVRNNMDDLVNDIVSGFCAIIFEGEKKAVTFEVKSGEKRSVSEPSSEKVVKGSKEGFVESLRVNTSLVRKKIKNPDLKIKESTVGRQTLNRVSVVYIDSITNKEFVKEVEKRLEAIDVDEIITTGNFEGFLIDNKRSPLPQLIYTERVDKFCLNICEGRVGIIIDGLPICYITPATFGQFMKAPEDSSEHFIIASVLTIIRYICLIITLFIPAFYVAVTMYHQEMLPAQLLQAVINSKENVPFSTPFEVLGMLLTFELLQEAAVRLPNPLGDTISLVGALVVGQSAVEAKVLSPLVVIIIGLAGIAGYTVTNIDLNSAIRVGRICLVVVALFFGMYGIAIGAALIIYHMASLTSLGVPYMIPFAGADFKALSQAMFNWPPDKVKFRERALETKNRRKQK